MSTTAKPTRARRAVDTRKLLLESIALNARAKRDTDLLLTRLIARADKSGIKQTDIAKAAGVSQASVSRTLAAARETAKPSKRTSAAKTGDGNGSV